MGRGGSPPKMFGDVWHRQEIFLVVSAGRKEVRPVLLVPGGQDQGYQDPRGSLPEPLPSGKCSTPRHTADESFQVRSPGSHPLSQCWGSS